MVKKNIPNNDMYKKIAVWLDNYHATDDYKKKAKLKTLIVATMIPVVKHLAKTIARRSTDPIEDLVQAGSVGLLKSIDRYSKDKNDNFRVFAGYFIIGEMKHYLRDKLNTIRVPRHIQELCVRISNFTSTLTYEELQNLTSDEVASALEIPASVIDFALMADRRSSTVSLEDVFSVHNDSLGYEEILLDEAYQEQVEFEDAKIIFDGVIEKLPPEHRVIIDMYYKQDMNQKEIAEALLITPRMVSWKMKKAFDIISTFVAENSLKRANEIKMKQN